jgi:hypothetical protein
MDKNILYMRGIRNKHKYSNSFMVTRKGAPGQFFLIDYLPIRSYYTHSNILSGPGT